MRKIRKSKKGKIRMSGHKHNYSTEVLFKTTLNNSTRYSYAEICSVCGKIGKTKHITSRKVKDGKRVKLTTREEASKAYLNLSNYIKL